MQELCCSDWGNYHIQYCLGSGGMGEVYRAIQKGLNRPVAIKILSPQLANNPQVIKRFQKEAQLAAQISHPNLVQIYDVGQHGDYHFIAMEYVNGSPLQRKIPSQQGLPIKDAVRYLYESAKGLKALHQREIIHRDIKPDNIMIGNEELKLTDFGLAKFEDDSQELTKHGAIIGTPYYMAPEQCLGKPATKLSDIYSLGLTFYYMIKGSLPYKGENTLEIITERINNPSPQFSNEIPKKIEKIYEKMIADIPEKRYSSIEELLREIENLNEADYTVSRYRLNKSSWKYIAIIAICLFMIVIVTRSVKRKKINR